MTDFFDMHNDGDGFFERALEQRRKEMELLLKEMELLPQEEVTYEAVLLENPDLRIHVRDGLTDFERCKRDGRLRTVARPRGVTKRVQNEIYGIYGYGNDKACVDVVVVAQRPDGKWVVVLARRKSHVSYAGFLWMAGGATQAFDSHRNFVARRLLAEFKLVAPMLAMVGVYRTMDPKLADSSTTQPCYVAKAKYEDLVRMAHDDAHSSIGLYTLEDLAGMSGEHWYPRSVSEKILNAFAD